MKNIEGKYDQQWDQTVNPKVGKEEKLQWESPL